ncbi:tRNA dihydrouridine synthase DusB [Arsukibacterium indicum]|uniref:tRNA-dihydrouridine synthase B n=1 Tax=Arsukibacterium indicum TaxID=2848612 RepID=A0ABS6MPP5_9GAMM|nr:tRNA dihydrouridine synthase DusB [Arsukibacterium indicum]MBV2130761.1 tRNA dihydrouridine synthase DusB [Arsukibacterium indicum]
MVRIGPYQLANKVICAPMAGVTDHTFRELCRRFGAALAVSEMLSSNPQVWQSEKSQNRMGHRQESGIRSVQIAGSDPAQMAAAAQYNVEIGADIIDINMGCPAKKVNKKLAGSALLQYPELVEDIIQAVVKAVTVPVTLKIRTGWDPEHRNGVQIARIAENSGIQALAVHGRTKACMYKGEAEYDTIKAIKQAVSLPVIANGDITTPEKAQYVLNYTGADAIMIGRAAQGRPWIFREVTHYLATGEKLAAPAIAEVQQIMLEHVQGLHQLYGVHLGPRIARKHVGWYLAEHDAQGVFRSEFNAIEQAERQLEALNDYFHKLAAT